MVKLTHNNTDDWLMAKYACDGPGRRVLNEDYELDQAPAPDTPV